VKDKISPGRPRILDERDDHDIVRKLNNQNTSTAAAIGRELRSMGLQLSDDIVRRSLQRQGMQARVKVKKRLLTKKHRA